MWHIIWFQIIYLFERYTNTHKEIGRIKEKFQSLVHFPNVCNTQVWARLNGELSMGPPY